MENNDIVSGQIAIQPFEINMKYTPHIILLTIIFILQLISRRKEEKINKEAYTDEHKSKGRMIMYRYIIVLQLAKAADWAINPYIFEFLRTRRFINFNNVGNLIAISFISNLTLGPLLIGYIIDKSNKKLPCFFYCFLMIVSCLVRFIKNPMALIFSQITYGASTSLLNTCFENWLLSEIRQNFENERIRELVLSNILEKISVWDSMTAIIVTTIAGLIYVFLNNVEFIWN